MSTCFLLAIRNKLNTNDRISKWSPNIDQTCVLCSNHNEDRDHLFFNYTYLRKMLDDLMSKFKINVGNNYDLSNVLETVYQAQNNNSTSNQTINIMFASLIWNIWCERNSRVFNGIELPFKLRLKHIIQDSKLLIQHNLKPQSLSSEMKLILKESHIASDPSTSFRPP